jgi:LemA protein
MTLLLAAAAAAVVVFWLIGGHNRLVALRGRVKGAFAQIDVHLKHRYRLVPLLVDAARASMKHERETLEEVSAAREVALTADLAAAADPGDAGAMGALIAAEQRLSGALARLFALAEAYPDLKANPAMQQSRAELAATEGRIAFARQAFNDAVASFNQALQQFPSRLLGAAFSLRPAAPLGDAPTAADRHAAARAGPPL